MFGTTFALALPVEDLIETFKPLAHAQRRAQAVEAATANLEAAVEILKVFGLLKE